MGGFHQVVKYGYHQITDLCFRKTKAFTALIPNFIFVLLHLFEGTDRIYEMIETFYDLSFLKAIVQRSGLGV